MPFAAALCWIPPVIRCLPKLTSVTGFTRKAVTACASAHLSPGSQVAPGQFPWFAGIGEAGCQHLPVVLDARKPSDLPALV